MKNETPSESVTAETITRRLIRCLLNEAALAGDSAMVELCETAERVRGIDPHSPVLSATAVKALQACVDAINAARAAEEFGG